ncbi:hypothetical protein L202_07361 [Cryptococcus amylolentus CBS 6039]|uniref:BHLH domain-containing protein n=1 Tax=Cryptococcus amylolentus CBS 6039 TaxID=1295533 RepID=A0A1E3HBX7_9TREE|nr:hypothetical protein L202_07361 [Cryptococcus amylolentus CBS 6039]ODN73837.1 hypothetical protein L202_07361 [Cryptococcus amylolentus CBS 6039]
MSAMSAPDSPAQPTTPQDDQHDAQQADVAMDITDEPQKDKKHDDHNPFGGDSLDQAIRVMQRERYTVFPMFTTWAQDPNNPASPSQHANGDSPSHQHNQQAQLDSILSLRSPTSGEDGSADVEGTGITPEIRFSDEMAAQNVPAGPVSLKDDGQQQQQQQAQQTSQQAQNLLAPPQSGTSQDGEKGKDSTFSRSPELRITHKLAERKRRKEMKELFDELRDELPADRTMKASKWEILSKAVEHMRQLKAAQVDHQRELEHLRRENEHLRATAYAHPPPHPHNNNHNAHAYPAYLPYHPNAFQAHNNMPQNVGGQNGVQAQGQQQQVHVQPPQPGQGLLQQAGLASQHHTPQPTPGLQTPGGDQGQGQMSGQVSAQGTPAPGQ